MASHGYDWANVRNKPTAHSRSPSVEYPPNVGAEGFESDSDDEGVEGSCGIPSSGDLASPGASPGGPSVSNTAGVTLRSPGNHQRMDAYRFSLLNLEARLFSSSTSYRPNVLQFSYKLMLLECWCCGSSTLSQVGTWRELNIR